MSIKFDIHSPAAQQLVGLAFEKIKEVWDPSLNDDAVAQYAVALAAKGSDRKKLTNTLSTILGEEATSDLLDWLLKYIKLNKQELTSSKGPPKAKASKAAKEQAKAAPKEEAPQAAAEPDDIEDLINEGLPQDIDDGRIEHGDEVFQDEDGDGHAAAGGSSSHHQDDQVDRRKRERSPEQHDTKRSRPKSAIQWAPPSSKDTGRRSQDGAAPDAAELEARRQRFGRSSQGGDEPGGQDKDQHDKDGDKDGRSRRGPGKDREREGHPHGRRSRSRSRSASPLRRGGPRVSRDGVGDARGREWDRGKERDWDRHGGPGLRREVDRPPHPDMRGPAGDRWRSPRGDGFGRPPWGEDDRGGWGIGRDREGGRWGSGSPEPERLASPPRPRLRSAVSGGLQEPAAPEPEHVVVEPRKQAVLGASRLLGMQLFNVLGEKLLRDRPRARLVRRREEVEGGDGGDNGGGGKQGSGSPEAEVKEVRKNVFDRLGKDKPAVAAAPEHKPAAAARRTEEAAAPAAAAAPVPAKAVATGSGAREEAPAPAQQQQQQQPKQGATAPVAQPAAETQSLIPQLPPIPMHSQPQPMMMMMPQQMMMMGGGPRMQGGGGWFPGSQDMMGPGFNRGPAGFMGNPRFGQHDGMQGGGHPVMPTKPSATAIAAAGFKPSATAMPGLQSGATLQPAPTKPSATVLAAAALQKSAAAAAAAAPVRPAAAVKPAPGPATVQPSEAAGGSASDEMAKIMAALKAKELEINRIKGQLAIQSVLKQPPGAAPAAAAAPAPAPQAQTRPSAAQRAESDARSIVVQNVPAAATDELLKTHFSSCGQVLRVTVLYDRLGRPLGQAYVEFASPDIRVKALAEMKSSLVLGQPIRVVPKVVRPVGSALHPQAGGGKPGGGGRFAGEAGKRLADAGPLKTGANVWRRQENAEGGQEGAPAAAPAPA